ncbi:hypothetical protein [Streptomyces virginiae]|uniref:hypothetical protein n=1 Tax=Streptomyces virginiae TaxID=1961 RepID=UPI003649F6CA
MTTTPVPRHTVPVDVHLVLRRDGALGPEVLLSRRAGPVYATGSGTCPPGTSTRARTWSRG